jgi:hypothetical protein
MEELLRVIEKEIEYYKDRENNTWSSEKNEGFKEGLEYCKNLVFFIKERSTD